MWQPLIRSADELVAGDTVRAPGNDRTIRFRGGDLELHGSNVRFMPKFTGRNYIVRGSILEFSGKNVLFSVRRIPGTFHGYGAWFNNPNPALDWPICGIGKHAVGKPWQDIRGTMQRVHDHFPVEFAVSAFGNQISIYINGEQVVRCIDDESAAGGVSVGLTGDSHAVVRNLEVCVLDGTDLTPDDVFPRKVDPEAARLLTAKFLTPELKKWNLLRNGSFEGSDTSAWSVESWRKRPKSHQFVSGQGHDGDRMLLIDNPQNDDVAIKQTVSVKPGTRYLLSGWIRTENVRLVERQTYGAHLYVWGGHERQKTNLEGSHDWTYQAIVFRSGNRNSIAIAARLGNFASTASGKAWFDDLCLVEIPDSTSTDDESRFLPLFDGATLTGWEGDETLWKVENGAIVGDSPGIEHNQFLATKKPYADFELRLEFKLTRGRGNSGIQFRSRREAGSRAVSGYQADIGEKNWGCLYDEHRRNKVLVQAPAALQQVLRTDDWNSYVIRSEGGHVTLRLNGLTTVDYVETDAAIPRSGIIALQVHSGPPMRVEFRRLRIQELPAPL